MYRVVLVDDDMTMRLRLKNLIRWEALDCEIAGEASHGIEAASMLEECRPDIMITDIYMPGMNGVDLIRYAREHFPEMFILALSSYDDFDYVRSSLKYGAFDYVLKHQLTAAKLEAMIGEAVAYLGKNRTEEIPEREPDETHLLRELLAPGAAFPAGSRWAEQFRGWYFLLAVGRLADQSGNGQQNGRLADRSGGGQQNGRSADRSGGGQQNGRLADQSGNGQQNGRPQTAAGLGGIEEKKLRYMEALITETLLFYDWKILCEPFGDDLVLLFRMEEEPAIRNVEDILSQVSRNVERFIGLRLAFSVCDPYRDIAETAQQYRRLQNREPESGRGPERTDGAANPPEAACLPDRGRERAGGRKPDESYPNEIVNKAVRYIRENYRTTVSLQEVADALNINSAYLSRLFKKYTRRTIVTYINDRKMEKAHELIEQGSMPMKEIAAEVGFQNYNYFSQMFKKYYGKSPSEL